MRQCCEFCGHPACFIQTIFIQQGRNRIPTLRAAWPEEVYGWPIAMAGYFDLPAGEWHNITTISNTFCRQDEKCVMQKLSRALCVMGFCVLMMQGGDKLGLCSAVHAGVALLEDSSSTCWERMPRC
jgi:hypothetical protein